MKKKKNKLLNKKKFKNSYVKKIVEIIKKKNLLNIFVKSLIYSYNLKKDWRPGMPMIDVIYLFSSRYKKN